MNFTYLYRDDPDNDVLYGNLTWVVPNTDMPAHWMHAEYNRMLNIWPILVVAWGFFLSFYLKDVVAHCVPMAVCLFLIHFFCSVFVFIIFRSILLYFTPFIDRSVCVCVCVLVSKLHGGCEDEGIYNTYIIDTDYEDWALIMHCGEKKQSNRYLSALMLSRKPEVPKNVNSFLR